MKMPNTLPWSSIAYLGDILDKNNNPIAYELDMENADFIVSSCNKIKELYEFINKEIKDIEDIILERAKLYKENANLEEDYLLDIDMDKELITNYDQEDYANHNFDVGLYRGYYNILNILNK